MSNDKTIFFLLNKRSICILVAYYMEKRTVTITFFSKEILNVWSEH